MNLNKKYIFLFSFLVLTVIFVQYETSNTKEFKLASKSLQTLDEKAFEQLMKKYETNREFNKYWGFSKEKIKIVENVEENLTSKSLEVTKKDGQNLLCITSSCYRLLGIYHKKDSSIVTLYNKNLKEKIKDYQQNDILESGIKIETILTNRVIFKEINSTRSWEFKIFDVNQTKYEPKKDLL